MAKREGIVRFDSDLGAWCFDEEYQIQALEEFDQVAIRILDCFLSWTVVLTFLGNVVSLLLGNFKPLLTALFVLPIYFTPC